MDGNSSHQRRIALLAGGQSAERAISLASGQQAADALTLAGYLPIAIDPAQHDLDSIDWSSFDACFIALHGGAGEDGGVQAQLERIGIPYSGSDSTSSRLAMNKSAAKHRWIHSAVPTPRFAVLQSESISIEQCKTQLAPLGYPLVVKPNSQGSSFGVGIARTIAELQSCLEAAAQFGTHVLVEQFVTGREFTVALLGRNPLPLIEIIAPKQFFSHEAKYSNPATEFRFDTNLPPHVEENINRIAVAAAESLGTAGLVRVDLILDAENRPWILEANTVPGLTSRSLAPRAAQAAGIDLPALMDWMVHDALDRFKPPRKSEHHSPQPSAVAFDYQEFPS